MKQYRIILEEVKENGITVDEITFIRNTLSDLVMEPRIQLCFANAIIDCEDFLFNKIIKEELSNEDIHA